MFTNYSLYIYKLICISYIYLMPSNLDNRLIFFIQLSQLGHVVIGEAIGRYFCRILFEWSLNDRLSAFLVPPVGGTIHRWSPDWPSIIPPAINEYTFLKRGSLTNHHSPINTLRGINIMGGGGGYCPLSKP